MRCLILAAGASRRLQSVTLGRPKCLLPLGGKALLQRIIEPVLAAGVADLAMVTGHRAPDIRTFLASAFPGFRFTLFHNLSYASTNNLYSLLLAKPFLLASAGESKVSRGDSLLLLDSDILFGKPLLDFFLGQREVNRLAVRVSGLHDTEEVRVQINRYRRILKIGKEIPLEQTFGESIGMEVFSPAAVRKLVATLDRRVASGTGRTEFYEASFQEMIDRGVLLKAIDISAFPVAEIDTPEDLRHAERSILPLIDDV